MKNMQESMLIQAASASGPGRLGVKEGIGAQMELGGSNRYAQHGDLAAKLICQLRMPYFLQN